MQPNQFFFPLTQETTPNSDPTQSKRILDISKYNGQKKLNHRLTIPFIWYPYYTCSKYNEGYTLQFISEANDVYYQQQRLDNIDVCQIDVLNFYTENTDPFEFKDNAFIPTLSQEDLRLLYNHCQVIDPEEQFLLTKPSFENLATTPYLWKRKSEESTELEFDEDDNVLVNGVKYERSFEVPTLHKIGKSKYHFKPTLQEVLAQLPCCIYDSETFLITTEMLSSDINIMAQGDYHIGVSVVYTPVIEHDSKRQRTDNCLDNYTSF